MKKSNIISVERDLTGVPITIITRRDLNDVFNRIRVVRVDRYGNDVELFFAKKKWHGYSVSATWVHKRTRRISVGNYKRNVYFKRTQAINMPLLREKGILKYDRKPGWYLR